MADFKQIDEARRLLGLEECATLKEIRNAYRKLAFTHHPDKCKDEEKKVCEEMFKKIAHANDILMSYCAGYEYSFKEADVGRETEDKAFYEHLKRFYDGWFGETTTGEN
ncbi:J domain-containing protein [bacterium]|nr:J domain-containing protein [bacterium]